MPRLARGCRSSLGGGGERTAGRESPESVEVIHFEDQRKTSEEGEKSQDDEQSLTQKPILRIYPSKKMPKTHMMNIMEIMKKKKGLTINYKPITTAALDNSQGSSVTFEKAE
jgi:hypothetical protein